MEKRTLEQAFNAVFHSPDLYNEFFDVSLKKEVNSFYVGSREVFSTSKKLRRFLRFIDKVLFRNLAIDNDVVHSFTKNRNVLSALEAHRSSRFFFKTDIENFYDSITTNDVCLMLHRNRHLIPICDIEEHINFLANFTTYNNSLPVGFPTSPQLSNSFLLDFDQELKRYCVERALVYTRYADDLIISGERREEFEVLQEVVQDILLERASEKMRLRENKTFFTHFGNKVKILGLVILPNGKITIDYKYKKKIETLVHFYINDRRKFEDFMQSLGISERSLYGLLHYAKSVDSEYINKLERKYGIYSLHALMEDRWSDKG